MDQQRLDRIRLLSARFHELQGLRLALAGACLAIGMGGYLIGTSQPTSSGAMIAAAASFVPVMAAMPWLNRYYATTFRRQTRTPPRHAPIFVIVYFVIATTLHVSIPSIPEGAPTMAIVGLASLFVAIRDWPWRAYYVGAAAAAVIGFTVSEAGIAPVFLLIGVSFVPIGLLDHLLLVKLMKDVRAAAPATE